LASQLQTALSSRVMIEQAKGMLAERAGIDIDSAFNQIRHYARSHNLQLTRICESLVSRSLPLDAVIEARSQARPTRGGPPAPGR